MSRFSGILGVLLVLGLSMGFAALNGGQRVTLRLGFATFYRVPLTVVAFGALIMGMVVMLVASIHSDLKVRKILRERLAREDEEERARLFVDRHQQDLFEQEDMAEENPEGEVDADPLMEDDLHRNDIHRVTVRRDEPPPDGSLPPEPDLFEAGAGDDGSEDVDPQRPEPAPEPASRGTEAPGHRDRDTPSHGDPTP